MISMRLNVHDLKRLKVMLMKLIHLIVQNVCTLPTGPHLADAGPNARPGRGASLSSDFMTSSCSINRVTIVVERRYAVQH